MEFTKLIQPHTAHFTLEDARRKACEVPGTRMSSQAWGQRRGRGREREEERRTEEVAAGGRMVTGRCTQVCFQLHSAHITSCTHVGCTQIRQTQPAHLAHCSPKCTHTQNLDSLRCSALPIRQTDDTHIYTVTHKHIFSRILTCCHSPAASAPLPAPAQPHLTLPGPDPPTQGLTNGQTHYLKIPHT